MRPQRSIGEHIELQRGTTYKSALLGLPGPVLLGLASIARDGGFRDDSLRTYGGESPEKLLLRPGDIYVSLKDVTQSGDLLGAVARVPSHVSLGRLTQDTVKLTLLSGAAPSSFLYWVLRSPEYRQYCRARAIGTTNLSLAREDFLAFSVPDPTRDQLSLVQLFDAIDDKIELNRRMNETLEAIAQALFKSWFIDFDPVRAKMTGRTPSGMDAATAALFPDSLEASVNGPIPKGWTISAVGVHVSLQRGTTYQSRLLGLPGPHLLGLASIQRNGGFRRDKLITYGGESPTKLLLRPGDLYVSLKDVTQAADLLGAVAVVPPDIMVGRLTQDTVKLEPTTQDVSRGYLYRTLTQPMYRAYCRARAIGTTNLSLAREDFLDYPVLVPSREIMAVFSNNERLLRDRLDASNAESRTLALTRELLLPKLFSGELRIRDAKREAEKVA